MKLGKIYVNALWLLGIFALACLTSCATPDTTYVPTVIKEPVPVPCKVPKVSAPNDLLLTLPASTSLTDGMKSCLAQHDYDLGYQSKLVAAMSACSE